MKKTICLMLALVTMFGMTPAMAEETETSSTSLVVYFSRTGENYNVGVVEEGNTAKMAKIIAEQEEADLFELVPVVPYSDVYDEALEQAKEEQHSNARPEYEGEIENWDQYDTVFIGYPIWWGQIPNIVYTFMEEYDFSGKTVVPFNTHEGSGQAGTQQDIEELLSDADVLQGLAVSGSKAQTDAEGTGVDVKEWLEEIGLL